METFGIYHILFGSFIYFPLFFTTSPIAAFLAVAFFYLGRERRDYEIKEKIPIREWYKGWNVFEWCLSDLFVIPFFATFTAIFEVTKWVLT